MVPLADRYLKTRSANDAAITSLGESVRTDLGRVAKAHIDLAGRLDEFAAHVDIIATETRQTRAAAQNVELRITTLEQRLATQRLLLAMTLAVNVLSMILLAALLLRSR